MLHNYTNTPVASTSLPLHVNHTAKLDSGASRHYFKPLLFNCLDNVVPIKKSSIYHPSK